MDILLAFLRLGLTSFGGPVAHLGYFRTEFVERRRWLDEAAYADLVGFCQFLPGPTSSQVGFAIGLSRRGPIGGLLAFAGFTLPSAVLMVLLAEHARRLPIFGGLRLVAVAVVGHALIGMARTLAPDLPRAAIAAGGGAIVLIAPPATGPVLAVALGALAGLALRTPAPSAEPSLPARGRRFGTACLAAAALLLLIPATIERPGPALALFDAFARAGALVFGGGHVVLPMLQARVTGPGLVTQADFLAGYGAAQAMPGPLFTVATYLGAVAHHVPNGILGATIATVAIFAPGLLLTAGLLPFWHALRRSPAAQAAMRGCNASVVGVLAAAFYDPVVTTGIRGPLDALAAVTSLVLLVVWRSPPILIVVLGVFFAAMRNLS